MDEAEILSDKISILGEGRLLASGSPRFLKDYFECGYRVLFSSVEEVGFSDFQAGYIFKIVGHYLEKAKMELTPECFDQTQDHSRQELSLRLPHQAIEVFPILFKRLERDKEILGIQSFGVMAENIDAVFLKCMARSENYRLKRKSLEYLNSESNHFKLTHEKFTKTDLSRLHFKSCFNKNLLVASREKFLIFIQIIIILLFTYSLALMAKGENAGFSVSPTPVKLDLNYNSYFDVHKNRMEIPFWVNDGEDFDQMINDPNSMNIPELREIPVNTSDIFTSHMLQIFQNKSSSKFDQKYFLGLGLDKTSNPNSYNNTEKTETIYYHFNGQHFHSAAQSQNFGNNFILKKFLNDSGRFIKTFNYPLGLNKSEEAGLMTDSNSSSLSSNKTNSEIYTKLLFLLTMLLAINSKNKLNERISKSKHTQFLTGLSDLTYWSSFYLFDIIYLTFLVTFIPVVFYILNDSVFGVLPQATFILELYLILAVIAALPKYYLLQKYFSSSSGCVIVLMMGNYLVASIFDLYVRIFMEINAETERQPGQNQVTRKTDLQNYNFLNLFLTEFTFINTLTTHHQNNVTKNSCQKSPTHTIFCTQNNQTYTENYLDFSESGTGQFLLIFAFQSVFWFGFLLLVEYLERKTKMTEKWVNDSLVGLVIFMVVKSFLSLEWAGILVILIILGRIFEIFGVSQCGNSRKVSYFLLFFILTHLIYQGLSQANT